MASLGDESAVIELHVPGGSSRKQNSSGSTLSFAGMQHPRAIQENVSMATHFVYCNRIAFSLYHLQ